MHGHLIWADIDWEFWIVFFFKNIESCLWLNMWTPHMWMGKMKTEFSTNHNFQTIIQAKGPQKRKLKDKYSTSVQPHDLNYNPELGYFQELYPLIFVCSHGKNENLWTFMRWVPSNLSKSLKKNVKSSFYSINDDKEKWKTLQLFFFPFPFTPLSTLP